MPDNRNRNRNRSSVRRYDTVNRRMNTPQRRIRLSRKAIVIIGCALLAIIAAIVIIVVSNSNRPPAEETSSLVPQSSVIAPVGTGEGEMTQEEYEEYIKSLGEMDGDTLAGLRGDDSAFDNTAAEAETLRVALLSSEPDTVSSIITGIEKGSQELLSEKKLDHFYVYTSTENVNQFIQDMRSIINKKCDVVIIAGVAEYEYGIAAQMAQDAGIELVTYNAPLDGYTFNVIKDLTTAKGYADFIKRNGASKPLLLSDKPTSEYSEQMLADLKEELPSITTAFASDEGYYNALLTLAPDAIVMKGSMAVAHLKKLLYDAAAPTILCSEATAGLIKLWQEYSTTGISRDTLTPSPTGTVEPSATPKPTEKPKSTSTPEPSATAEPTATVPVMNALHRTTEKIYASTAVSGQSIGRLLSRAAYLLATGYAPDPSSGSIYVVTTDQYITNENIATYYEKAKSESDETAIFSDADPAAIDTVFILKPRIVPPKEKGTLFTPIVPTTEPAQVTETPKPTVTEAAPTGSPTSSPTNSPIPSPTD